MLADKLRAATAGETGPAFISSSVNRSDVATNTVPAPTGIEDGDLLVAFGVNGTGTRTLDSLPAGFGVVKIDSVGDTFFIATKIASSESGDYSFTWSSGRSTIAIAVYRGAIGVAPAGVFSREEGVTTATAPSITPLVAGILCAAFYNDIAASVSTPPAGMTQRVVQTTAEPSLAMYDGFADADVGTGDRSLVWSVPDRVGGIQFQVIPEAPLPQFVTSASRASTDNTSTVVAPAGIESGDLLVFSDYVLGQTSGTVPTGFTQLVLTEVGTSVDHRTSYKIADGTESGTTITGMTGTDQACILVVFRGLVAPPSTGTWNSEGTSGNPAPQAVTAPTDSQAIVIYAAGSRGVTPVFVSVSPAFDSTISVSSEDAELALAYSVYQTSAAAQTADVNDSGSNNTLHSGYLAGA